MACTPEHRRAPWALVLPLVGAALVACGGGSRQPEPGPEEALTVTDFRPDLDRESTDGSAVAERTVGIDELPESHRELLDAWRSGGFIWEIHRGEALSDPDLTAFLVDNLLLLIFQEHKAIRDMAASDEAGESLATRRAAYARARAELPLLGAPAAEALAEAMAIGDDVLFTLVHDILEEMGAEGAPAVARLLTRDSALSRYRAASILGRLPAAGMREAEVREALAAAAADDASEIVRVQATRSVAERALWASAGRNLADVDLAPSREALEGCLQDPAEAVRVEALAGLDLLGDVRALEALVAYGEAAARDNRMQELSRAAGTVRGLTRQDLGADPDAWQAWWDDHSEELDR